jgi:CheY-like chemotaxis protein
LFVDADQRTPRPLPAGAGLGLGLSICNSIIDAHGGTIDATSAGVGLGSTFVVSLPTIEPAAAERSAALSVDAARAQTAADGLQILLVEDHEDSARMLACLLTLHGFRVEVAGTVRAAREKAHQLRYDVLISDLQLPDGNGLDLMRELRRSGPVCGIAVSGFGTPEDKRRSAEAGYAAHLTKPVDIPTLLEAISRVSAR